MISESFIKTHSVISEYILDKNFKSHLDMDMIFQSAVCSWANVATDTAGVLVSLYNGREGVFVDTILNDIKLVTKSLSKSAPIHSNETLIFSKANPQLPIGNSSSSNPIFQAIESSLK